MELIILLMRSLNYNIKKQKFCIYLPKITNNEYLCQLKMSKMFESP